MTITASAISSCAQKLKHSLENKMQMCKNLDIVKLTCPVVLI